MVPDLFHIVPVSNDTMLNWVLEGEDSTLGLCFVSNVSILLSHTNHNSLVARASDNRWEDSTRSIVSCKSGLAHSGSVVNDESLNFIIFFTFIAGTSAKTKDKVKGGLLLDVVVSKGASVFKLLSSEDEALLIRRNSFLILDLLLHSVDGIRRVDIKSDGFASQSLHENLHRSTTKAEDEVKSRLLLDVVVCQCATILKLLTSEDETLLIRRNSFFVLDLLLHGVDGIRRIDIQCDRLASQSLYKDLHGSSSKAENEVKGRLLLNVVIC
mmetsp:Transcript_13779/g.19310  ORF Transcript_13779/g.19310 Transcript_13779/m.19310 type:complete len:269 (+) Transcript_13779:538-1344(+)